MVIIERDWDGASPNLLKESVLKKERNLFNHLKITEEKFEEMQRFSI